MLADGSVRTYVVDDVRLQHGALSCPDGLAGKTFTINGLEQTQTDVLLRVDYLDGTASNQRLTPNAPAVTIPERPSALEVVRTYLVLGVEHILLGIDHLLFVLALLLIVNGIGRLVATVTAFTVAHSVTLGAATLGACKFRRRPSRRSSRSASCSSRRSSRGGRGRGGTDEAANLTRRFPWVVAFAFGLLHGFGFAGALSEVGVPQHAVPLALLFFNVGVELGQLVVHRRRVRLRLARAALGRPHSADLAARRGLRRRLGRGVLGRRADDRNLLAASELSGEA